MGSPVPQTMDPAVVRQQAQLIQSLRDARESHPLADAAAGLIPGVGLPQAIDDTSKGHYISGPLGMIPGEHLLAGATKAMIIGLKGWRRLDKTAATAAEKIAKEYRAEKASLTPDSGTMAALSKELRQKGAFLGPDGEVRHEISDLGMNLDPDMMSVLQKSPDVEASLTDLVDHPQLLRAHPELKDVKVMSSKLPGAQFSASSLGDPMIQIGTEGAPIDFMSHELQHASQNLAGRKPGFLGTNMEAAGGTDGYLNDFGEIEARVTAQRRLMNDAQRQQYSFPAHVLDEKSRLLSAPGTVGLQNPTIWMMQALRKKKFSE